MCVFRVFYYSTEGGGGGEGSVISVYLLIMSCLCSCIMTFFFLYVCFFYSPSNFPFVDSCLCCCVRSTPTVCGAYMHACEKIKYVRMARQMITYVDGGLVGGLQDCTIYTIIVYVNVVQAYSTSQYRRHTHTWCPCLQ
jgi:hypothetical protein